MASRFQATPLVGSPIYPNSITWSEENLLAVASGHVVTILNPALPSGPRGLITLPNSETFPIGVVKKDELLSECLLPASLYRDRTPCVRSISWSPLGMASNYGCLLAICTAEGRVKIYRSPFCDFCSEWIEVVDISDKLYANLVSTNFGESDILGSESGQEEPIQQVDIDDPPKPGDDNFVNSNSREGLKRRRIRNNKFDMDFEMSCDQLSDSRDDEDDILGSRHHPTMKEKRFPKVFKTKASKLKENMPDYSVPPLISARQYAFRNAMLSSLVVAWSPLLCLSSDLCLFPQNTSSRKFSILAVGAKSGKISIWRIYAPLCYSVEHSTQDTCVIFAGLLKAHNSWVISISLAFLDSSSTQILMVSGSSDGSVKIWLGRNAKDSLESSEATDAPFSLLKEVVSANNIPVSVLSLAVPSQTMQKIHLAVGRGSGSFEVWICEINSRKFDRANSSNPHGSIVTGLAWAFDGSCLYTCSQDNFVRCWILQGDSLCEVSIPSSTPCLRNSTDFPNNFLSCLGVATSPGNLVVAMVRTVDVDELDAMYEARSQKALVEFVWIGALKMKTLPHTSPESGYDAFIDFPASDLVCWESNILWSLQKYELVDAPLVIWDIVAALLAFKQYIPEYVDLLLVKWLSVRYLGLQMDLSEDRVLTQLCEILPKLATRQLQLFNVICRRIILSVLKPDEINSNLDFEVPTDVKGEKLTLWMGLLFNFERELRERLVGLTLAAFKNQMSNSADAISPPGCWCPAGVAQMAHWVALNTDHVKDQLKALALDVAKQKRKNGGQGKLMSCNIHSVEQCGYCSKSVTFDNPEVASCECLEGPNEGGVESHKLLRCSVSMQVCPPTLLWFCKCCHRRASKLAPSTFFTMASYPLDFSSLVESSVLEESLKPFCPFCGILLQRLQPEFLLSASPV